MQAILKKLGLTDQNPILIINAPEEFAPIMAEISAEIHTSIKGQYRFIQVFAKNRAEAEIFTKGVTQALEGDGYLWLCYPKGTSKRYKKPDINRDSAWDLFGSEGFEPVTQVAIDEDWSAIRFRHVDKIKKLTRKTAATEKGKERIKDTSCE